MLAGAKLGRYEVLESLGSGGMGEVYLAKDLQLGRRVALKVLLPEFCSDGNRVKRFLFEGRSVSSLNHPSIITIHEIVESDEKLFIATEFIEGHTVRELIESEKKLPESERIEHKPPEPLSPEEQQAQLAKLREETGL